GARQTRAHMRVVGIDLGERRVGVAVSDSDGTLASPYVVTERPGDAGRDHAEIARIVTEVGASTVVVGLPIPRDGTVGQPAKAARTEADLLAGALGVPVQTHDE